VPFGIICADMGGDICPYGFPTAISAAPMLGENLAGPGVPFGIICEDMGGDIWPYDIAGTIEGEATYSTPGDCLDEFMGACMS
jgi:hypothetical protein